MANTTLIMGESGTGKSSSIRQLDPKETFVINVLDKALPFKNFKKNYTPAIDNIGNYYATDDASYILKIIENISKNRKDIKNIIIDDFQYIMANEFMRKAREKGYEKFTLIAQQAWKIINQCMIARNDLYIFILSHTEIDSQGRSKVKTIGKMLDDKITLEGMFTVVLHSMIVNKEYKFLTQNNGTHIAKSPLDMFDKELIDNNLLYVKETMMAYLGDVGPKDSPKVKAMKDLSRHEETKMHIVAMQNAATMAELKEEWLKAKEKGKQWDDNAIIMKFTEEKDKRKNALDLVEMAEELVGELSELQDKLTQERAHAIIN